MHTYIYIHMNTLRVTLIVESAEWCRARKCLGALAIVGESVLAD